MMISVLHATRGRPKMANDTRFYWMKLAAKPDDIEWIYGVDQDDYPTIEHLSKPGVDASVIVNTAAPSNVAASNAAYRASSGKVIVQASDDYYPLEKGWDLTIIDWFNRFGGVDQQLVLGSGDSIGALSGHGEYSGDGMITMVVATRAYLERVGGFMLYPEYDGMVADFAFTQKAAIDGVLIDAYEQHHFLHDWHGSDADPLRDKTYYDHMTTVKNRQGWNTWASTQFAGLPDVIVHGDGIDRLDAQRAAGLMGPACLLGTPGIAASTLDDFMTWRRAYGGAAIENLPPKDEPRRLFLAGDLKGARAAIEPVIERTHKKICGGRFHFHYGVWMWDICTRQIQDQLEIGIDQLPLPWVK